jgi:hypothetical protein
MGLGVLLDLFEPSSQRLPPGLQQTTDDDYDDEKLRLSQLKEEASNQMQ